MIAEIGETFAYANEKAEKYALDFARLLDVFVYPILDGFPDTGYRGEPMGLDRLHIGQKDRAYGL